MPRRSADERSLPASSAGSGDRAAPGAHRGERHGLSGGSQLVRIIGRLRPLDDGPARGPLPRRAAGAAVRAERGAGAAGDDRLRAVPAAPSQAALVARLASASVVCAADGERYHGHQLSAGQGLV